MPAPTPLAPADPVVRGACPTGHRPFAAADGLLVRARPPAGLLTADQVAALARAVARADAGPVELTRRANLQVRGVEPGRFPRLLADLVAGGLVHPDARVDERRAVLAAPAAGVDPTEVLDTRPLAAAVLDRLAAGDGPPLHPKAGVLVDGGGAVSLRGRRYDVALGAARRRDTGAVVVEVTLGSALPAGDPADSAALTVTPGPPVEAALTVTPDAAAKATLTVTSDAAPEATLTVTSDAAADVAAAALALAADIAPSADRPARVADLVATLGPADVTAHLERRAGVALEPVAAALLARAEPRPGPPLGVHPQARAGTTFVGVAPALGRLDAAALAALADAAARHSPGHLRLTPWRSLLVTDVPADRASGLVAALAAIGLVTAPADPALAVVACAGSAGCPAGRADTQADARRLIARRRARSGAPPTVHLTGCDKRCASRAVHALTLVATAPGRYDALVADPSSPTGERLAARGVSADHAVDRVLDQARDRWEAG